MNLEVENSEYGLSSEGKFRRGFVIKVSGTILVFATILWLLDLILLEVLHALILSALATSYTIIDSYLYKIVLTPESIQRIGIRSVKIELSDIKFVRIEAGNIWVRNRIGFALVSKLIVVRKFTDRQDQLQSRLLKHLDEYSQIKIINKTKS